MKSLVNIKRVLVSVIFCVVCGLASAGNTEPVYIHTDRIENGKLMLREVSKKDKKGKTILAHKYEYVYDDSGNLCTKKIYARNHKKNKWVMQSSVHITKNDAQSLIEIKIWDKSGKNVQSSNLVFFDTDDNDNEFPQYVFRKDSDEEQWKVFDNSELIGKSK